jgi:hypothetical protein
MTAIPVWGRRIAIAVVLALAASTVQFPLPGVTAAAPQSSSGGRILIDQPDPPVVNTTPPPLPVGAPVKHESGAPRSTAGVHANHVSKLTPAQVQDLQAQGFAVLDNSEGRLLLKGVAGGKTQQFLIADAKLRSGREVVGFGVAPPTQQASASIIGKTAEAWFQSFAWCSYAYMNSYWDDLHVHLCAADQQYVLAIALVISAAVGTVIGLVVGLACGEICGPIVAVAVVSALAIALIGFWWLHTNPQTGDVDFVIPHWTMVSPF